MKIEEIKNFAEARAYCRNNIKEAEELNSANERLCLDLLNDRELNIITSHAEQALMMVKRKSEILEDYIESATDAAKDPDESETRRKPEYWIYQIKRYCCEQQTKELKKLKRYSTSLRRYHKENYDYSQKAIRTNLEKFDKFWKDFEPRQNKINEAVVKKQWLTAARLITILPSTKDFPNRYASQSYTELEIRIKEIKAWKEKLLNEIIPSEAVIRARIENIEKKIEREKANLELYNDQLRVILATSASMNDLKQQVAGGAEKISEKITRGWRQIDNWLDRRDDLLREQKTLAAKQEAGNEQS